MLLGLVGPDYCGKKEIVRFLKSQYQFTHVRISSPYPSTPVDLEPAVEFDSMAAVLDFVIRQWRDHFVLTGIQHARDWKLLKKRPFCLLVSIDAPVSERYHRYVKLTQSTDGRTISLESFIHKDDLKKFGVNSMDDQPTPLPSSIQYSVEKLGGLVSALGVEDHPLPLYSIASSADIQLVNVSPSVGQFINFLDTVDLLNHERLRPSWDTYFMKLCDLAASRSNCMKRRVGCILVKGKRIIATGYNGTPRGVTNCNDGGCQRCNNNSPCGSALDTCLCLHAEENALLEAGRERVGSGEDVILYCNTCPCLGCAKKIVQVGVKEVVYSRAYGMDSATEHLLQEAGVQLRKYQILGHYYSSSEPEIVSL